MNDTLEPCDDSGAPSISRIAVKGLHKRINFLVNFRPGINIIYGKNGIGKTTLLHIIANLSEIDIERFRNLNFEEITIENDRNQKIELFKKDADEISVAINGRATSYENGKSDLSESEQDQIREIIGDRATYLPAFRSVLERMRDVSYSPYEETRSPEVERLLKREARALESDQRRDRIIKRDQELARANVLKTVRCRQWFGEFVPVVRYPSILDVIDGLGSEWDSAQLTISRLEQRQFEKAFVSIFDAISKGNGEGEGLDQKVLLEKISNLIVSDDDSVLGHSSSATYLRLVRVAEETNERDKRYNNVLQIYVDILEERKGTREKVLRPTSDFQTSTNEFLSTKSLKIRNAFSPRTAPSRRSTVYIEPEIGKPYQLTALSSGERQIVTMLYAASRSPFKSGCLLIDEPELSLHVDWQRIVLGHIEKQHKGRQIIACTHSPEVGAEHEDRVQFFEAQLAYEAGDAADIDVEDA